MWLAALIAERNSDPHFPLALKVRIRTLRGPESLDNIVCDNEKFGSELSAGPESSDRIFAGP
jgi:hypothetical protein